MVSGGRINYFNSRVWARYIQNQREWGDQSREVVFEVLMEEIGEIARALLNRFKKNQQKDGKVNLEKECVNAAAVLLDIYERAEKLMEGGG